MSDAGLEDLVRRLRAGEDPAQVQRSLLGASLRTILRRCAVPRTFDRRVFDAVLCLAGHPALGELTTGGFLERVPGPGGLFRMRAEIRQEWLDQWPAGPKDRVPPGVAELCGLLADFYAANGNELEHLYHRAVSDPGAAARLATRLFDDADERFDLATCQDVLDALSDPGHLPWLGADLAELRADRHAYLRARSYWSTEWLQSARYLNRGPVDGRLQRLVSADGPRAMQLYARGGSGKTMQLRWLIARWCVPEPRRIPCARVDFDLASPPAAGHRPWLLLLELADQLNRQLPAAPFQELLNDRGVLRALLQPRSSPAALSAIGQLGSGSEQVAVEVTDRFVRTLDEAAGGRPVLLVFDTFEQVLLQPEGNPAAILALLAEVGRRCSWVRLLIAGRYDLRKRVPRIAEILPGLQNAQIRRFSATECRRYLRHRREITDAKLVAAMVTKCGGDPFVLALLADLARDRDGLTAAEVMAYDDPQTLYLVERIIMRVDESSVRWLLRYGIVPRRLRRDFVTEVMAPYLRTGMSGVSTVDAPATDELPEAVAGALFRTDVLQPAGELPDLDAAWEQLLRYASDSSWVSRLPEHPDAVQFHPELVTPMRRVLRRHRVFLDLHLTAAAYYARRADEDPAGWLSSTREAIYHRFQAGDPHAGDAWMRALDAAGDGDSRAAIADEVLGPDYVDEAGAPLLLDDRTPIISWSLLAQAHFERARAILRRAERSPSGMARALVEGGRRELRQVDRIRREHGWAGAADDELVQLQAAADRLDGETFAALEVVEMAMASREPDREPGRAALTEALADGLRATDPDRAADFYVELLNTHPLTSRWGARIGRKLVVLLAERDHLEGALEVLGRLAPAAGRLEGDALTLIEDGRIWLRAGRPGHLLRSIGDSAAESPEMADARDWCRAAANLALQEPFAALSICERAMDKPGRPPAGVQLRLNLELAELHAMINATLLKVDEAFAEVEYVTTGWRDLGESERSWAAAGAPADFDLRGSATLRRHAEYLLFSSADAENEPGGEGWFRRRLSSLRVAIEQRDADAAEFLRATAEALGSGPPPHRTVRLALAALPLDAKIGVRMLLQGLRQVDSIPARLTLLAPLRRCVPVRIPSEQRAELEDLLGPPPPVDAAANLLTWVEYQRVFGGQERAAVAVWALSGHWAAALDDRERTFRQWLVLDASERLGSGETNHREAVPDRVLQHGAESAPVLAAATGVLWALRHPGDPRTDEWLDLAGTLLSTGGASGSEWDAYLHVARAVAALAQGNVVRCRDHTHRAQLIWTRIQPDLPLPHRDRFALVETPVVEIPSPRWVRRITDWSPDQVVYRLAWDRDALVATTRETGRPDARILRGLTRVLDRRPAEPLSVKLDRLVSGLLDLPDTFSAQVGELMRDLPRFGTTPHRPVDVAVQTSSTFIGAVPWELGLRTGGVARGVRPGAFHRVLTDSLTTTHTTLALQRCLRATLGTGLAVDGLNGPETATAVQAFVRTGTLGAREWETLHAEAHRGLRPDVLVVRPSASRELAHGRGGLSEGVDVAQIYHRQGFTVRTISDADPATVVSEIRRTAARGRFAVLHVAGNFGSAHNEVYVEFASEREVSDLGKRSGHGSSSVIIGTALDRAFATLSPELPRPLVILDPGRPHGYSEAVRQLVLRNAFAHNLLELGNIPVILAMGLDHENGYELRNDLVRKLAAGHTADYVARRIRKSGGPEDWVTASVVLSTHIPPYAMPRWWIS